jgi:hypothetical protein
MSAFMTIIAAVCIVLLQIVLMVVGTTLLLVSDHAARFVYENSNFIESYVPALYRYSAAVRHTGDFYSHFSIRLFDGVLQLLVLGILTLILLRSIKGRRSESLGFRMELVFAAAMLLLLVPSYELLFNPYDSVFPFLSETFNKFARCLVVPGANLFLFLLIYARFWEVNYTRLARYRIRNLEPAAFSEPMEVDDAGKRSPGLPRITLR